MSSPRPNPMRTPKVPIAPSYHKSKFNVPVYLEHSPRSRFEVPPLETYANSSIGHRYIWSWIQQILRRRSAHLIWPELYWGMGKGYPGAAVTSIFSRSRQLSNTKSSKIQIVLPHFIHHDVTWYARNIRFRSQSKLFLSCKDAIEYPD